jgi:hypothetical protein
MRLAEMFRHIKDEHHDGQDEYDPEDMDCPFGRQNFEEDASLVMSGDCFREDIE